MGAELFFVGCAIILMVTAAVTGLIYAISEYLSN